MFDDVEAGHGAQASIRQFAQEFHRIGMMHVKLAFPALLEHRLVEIHACCSEVMVPKKFQPLATSASDVQDWFGLASDLRFFQNWKIKTHPLLYLITTSTKLIFETKIPRV